MARWLWLTNAPFTATGYGIQCREIATRMIAAGHEVAVACNFGLSGSALNWQGMTLYPLRMQQHCADVIGYYAQHFGADVVITLYDVWALPADIRERIYTPWAAMVPVDGLPINEQTVQRLKQAQYVIAYSQYARQALEQLGFEVDYCPHGIDTKVFKPGDKAKARQALGFPPDAFVISTVAANKGYPARKAWPEMMAAYARFKQDHPKALWYCHTTKTPYGSGGDGIYFDKMRDAIGLPKGALAFPDQGALAVGVPDEQIAMVYQASDVLLLASMGEGFGLPVLEAQACGCPVITQDCSAMTELTMNGIAIKPMQSMWLPQLRYYWQTPRIEDITAALIAIHDRTPEEAAKQNALGVKFVQDLYDYDKVWEQHWLPWIAKVEGTLW